MSIIVYERTLKYTLICGQMLDRVTLAHSAGAVCDIMRPMIIDGSSPFSTKKDVRTRSLAAFFSFLERRFDASFVREARRFPHHRPDLLEEFLIAEKLLRAEIITAVYPSPAFNDEPPYKRWTVTCTGEADLHAGGTSPDSDANALRAALAEALERYIWSKETDYFDAPKRASITEMTRSRAPFLSPYRFACFSDEQRANIRDLRITDSNTFLWVRGMSLVSGKKTYLPAQTTSGARGQREHNGSREPLIRSSITTGLATWPTKTGAHVRGVLENIERDAYAITWFNQLTLPRIALAPLLEANATLRKFVERCRRYRFKVHAVRLLSDAPTHPVCVILEDESDVPPRFSFGLKAHWSLGNAIEGALLEALRGHTFPRRASTSRTFERVEDVGHIDRVPYWANPTRSESLRFFINGTEETIPEQPFERDTTEEHLQRLVAWCKEKEYECVSVSLGTSRKNPMPWHIENIVIPELQPMHLFEKRPHIGGKRLTEVPKQFGYTPLPKPHTASPHPFA